MKMSNFGQNDQVTRAIISPKNLAFGAYQKFFGADNTLNYGSVKSKTNTQTILKQLPKNFEKSHFGAKICLTFRLPATTCEAVNRIFCIKIKRILFTKEIDFFFFI